MINIFIPSFHDQVLDRKQLLECISTYSAELKYQTIVYLNTLDIEKRFIDKYYFFILALYIDLNTVNILRELKTKYKNYILEYLYDNNKVDENVVLFCAEDSLTCELSSLNINMKILEASKDFMKQKQILEELFKKASDKSTRQRNRIKV